MDQSKLLNIVRRYLWLFVAAAVLAGLATYLVLNGRPRIYEAKTRLLVGPAVDNPSPDLNALRIGGQLMQTYADVVTTRPFLESINSKLDQKINLETLGGMIETKQNPDTRVLTILVRSRDPKESVAIANAAAQSLMEISPSDDNATALLRTQMSNQTQQLEQIITKAEASIEGLETELAALSTAPQRTPEEADTVLARQNLVVQQLGEERARMSDALRTLATIYQVLLDSNTNQLQIIEPAGAVFPVNQNLPLRVAASALAGLLLVMGIIFAYEYYDDTIRVPGDFNRSVKAPLLSTVEKHKPLRESGLEQVITFARPDSPAANSYRTAVAKLLFSIGKSMPSTFLLSSAGSQSADVAAIAAANLGIAFAQAGYRVVLVDAQLQNPVLSELFDASGKVGLYDLLTTKSSELNLMPVNEMSNLQFLPVGQSKERWSGAMLNSTNVIRRVEELQKGADIVLLAGPPATGYAESLTLASQVDGVILVARYGEAHSKLINEVAESLSDMNVQLAGVIIEKNQTPFAGKRILSKISGVTSSASKVGEPQVDASTAGPVEEGNVS
jgi:capsular polysaccharide biosynthesis protein/Mrp family chromosome partitioning ATPase